MSAGVLQFSLGLTAGGFLGVLDKAQGKVGGFAKSMLSLPGLGTALGGAIASVTSLHAVVDGVFSAIERGAALEHLSRRTDTSVASLYMLQKGFKAAGLEADAVGPTIFKMQKALGGVNEYGEDTKSVFHAIGLDIEALKQQNAPQQLMAIAGALRRLNSSAAANAAGTIFGREGAGNIVQLSRSTEEFTTAMRKAAQDAALFQRNAESFAKLDRTLTGIRNKTQTLFAGLAEGAAPGIQAISDQLNKIDLTKLGQNLGLELSMAIKAVDLGEFQEYFTLSIEAGVQAMSNQMMGEIAKWYNAMNKDNKDSQGNKTGFWGEVGHGALGVVQGVLGVWDSIGGLVSNSTKNLAVKRFIQAQENFDKVGPNFGNGILTKLADPIMRGMNGDMENPYLDKLKKMRGHLKSEVQKDRQQNESKPVSKMGGKLELALGQKYKHEGNDFEKMGFVMGGISNPALDYQRRTAIGVERMTTQIARLSLAGQTPQVNQL